MHLTDILDEIRGTQRRATADDVRRVFGDYHNMLRWLAIFLSGDEKLADTCIVDACNIADHQTPVFHEWLIRWAARATVGVALQRQHDEIVELAHKYEAQAKQKDAPGNLERPPISPEIFLLLIKHAEQVRAGLDILGRFVLLIHGIAGDSYEQIAERLGISAAAVERAYCLAFDTLEGAAAEAPDGIPLAGGPEIFAPVPVLEADQRRLR